MDTETDLILISSNPLKEMASALIPGFKRTEVISSYAQTSEVCDMNKRQKLNMFRETQPAAQR